MTKIFCDIADIKFIKKFNKKKIVKGFTTNPSLMRKAGAKNYKIIQKKFLKFVNLNLYLLKFLLMTISFNDFQALKIKIGKKYLCKSSSNKFKRKILWEK